MKLKPEDLIEGQIYKIYSFSDNFSWLISYQKMNNFSKSQGFSIYVHNMLDVENCHNNNPVFYYDQWQNIENPSNTELEYYHSYKAYLKLYGKKLQLKDFLSNIENKIYECW